MVTLLNKYETAAPRREKKGKSMPVKRKVIDEVKFPEYNKLVIELVEEEEKKEKKYKQLEFEFDEDLVAPI